MKENASLDTVAIKHSSWCEPTYGPLLGTSRDTDTSWCLTYFLPQFPTEGLWGRERHLHIRDKKTEDELDQIVEFGADILTQVCQFETVRPCYLNLQPK